MTLNTTMLKTAKAKMKQYYMKKMGSMHVAN
jgi:hypothetical protein